VLSSADDAVEPATARVPARMAAAASDDPVEIVDDSKRDQVYEFITA
jgi:hypothetical protein